MIMALPKHSLMIDIAGFRLSQDEMSLIRHPLIGGVILFARNFQSSAQVHELVTAIRFLRKEPILIAVDYEGGRVQRFHDGFTKIPPMGDLGQTYDQNPTHALKLAYAYGVIIAYELGNLNIDLSFSPVLDLDLGLSEIIGNRAFHSNQDVVIQLASEMIEGLYKVGMCSVGKHFPSHSGSIVDSHKDVVFDDRKLNDLSNDLLPYVSLGCKKMKGIMLSHVIFRDVCEYPVSLSTFWIRDIVKERLKLGYYLFSDDLSMEGLSHVGDMIERVYQSIDAGANMAIVCNQGDKIFELIDGLAVDELKSQIEINKTLLLDKKLHANAKDEYRKMLNLVS